MGYDEEDVASPVLAAKPVVAATTQKEARRHTIMKYASLGLLVPHTIIYTLLVSIARRPDPAGHVFYGPSAVVMIECLKMSVSLMGVARDSAERVRHGDAQDGDEYTAIPSSDDDIQKEARLYDDKLWHAVYRAMRREIWNLQGLRLIVPALLYVFQNNLQVFAAGVLTPAEYQVVGQTKLAFAAMFSVMILKRQLNFKHWRSIVGLVAGTTIVQIISANAIPHTVGLPVKGVRTQWDFLVGTLAMLSASAFSGLAGVLIEKLMKQRMAFWTTNLHLAFFSLLPAAVPVFTDAIYKHSFAPLRYFTPLVFGLVAFNVLGGIITSLTMKYADNILKNIAESIALVALVFLSSAVSGIPITPVQVMGTVMIVLAIAGYARA